MLSELGHIIAAFDGSETSKKAIEWGVRLKKAYPHATLTVVHVFKERVEQKAVGNPPGPGFVNDGMYMDPIQTQTARSVEQNSIDYRNATHAIVKDSTAMAKNKALLILSEMDAEGNFEILEGNPAENICSFAKRKGADIIIVGSSSKSGLRKFFLGSTSTSVANEAHCPVLIAK